MGEVNKEETKKEEEKKEGENKEEKKEEEKKEEVPQEIVLKVDMHCEACARKVARSLKGFEGVEDVTADCKASKVVVKGENADPIKVRERIKKKSGRKVEIISPLPKPPEEKKEEIKELEKETKEEPPPAPPAVITVVLKVRMHCEACAQALQKRIRKLKGVESVTTDLANDQITVKGVVDPEKLVNDVYKKTGKQASIVKEEKEEEKKEEEEKKKEDEKKDDEKKVDEEKKKDEENKGVGEEKEEKEEDKISNDEIKRSEYLGPKYYMEYANYPPPPQYFSDENPNACCVM